MKPIQERLYAEFCKTGLSVGDLQRQSGLPVARSTMSKKLRGKAPMSTVEAEAIAQTIGWRVQLVRRAA